MKNSLLTLLLLVSFIVAIQSQDVNNIDQDFNIEENLAPHIHLHENGFYYVGDDFLNPNSDRGNKPVLDSIVHVSADGDTTYKYTQIFTFNEDNRISSYSKKQFYPSSNQGYVIESVNFFYETIGDEIIQYDTSYLHLQAGVGGPTGNRIINFNSKGVATKVLAQEFDGDEWVDSYKFDYDFNEFGCLLSFIISTWSGGAYYPTASFVYTCQDSLQTSELYNNYLPYSHVAHISRRTEYDYNELNDLEYETVFRPNPTDPNEYILVSVSNYSYNEMKQNDSVIFQLWDHNIEEFYSKTIINKVYDELNNVVEEKTFKYDNSNNLYLSSNLDQVFNNNYLKGEFISGNINNSLNSMLLRNTYYSLGNVVSDTQYFYSNKSVSSKEKVRDIHFEVYPNPTSGDLNINISDIIDDKSQIVIRNSTGSVVFSQYAESKNNLNLANLPSGFYLVSVEGSNFRSEMKKLIIQ